MEGSYDIAFLCNLGYRNCIMVHVRAAVFEFILEKTLPYYFVKCYIPCINSLCTSSSMWRLRNIKLYLSSATRLCRHNL